METNSTDEKNYTDPSATPSEQMSARLWHERRRHNLTRVLQSYTLVGASFTVFSLTYLLYSVIQVDLTRSQMLALILGLVGFSTSVISLLTIRFYSQRTMEIQRLEMFEMGASLLLANWLEFERIGRAIINASDYPKSQTLRSIMVQLRRQGRIDDVELEELRMALELRNTIVHGSGAEIALPLSMRMQESAFAVARITRKLMMSYERDL